MSDGMSDSRREESATWRIRFAAEKLADALLAIRDQAFGYPPMTLEVANAELRRAKVKLEDRK